MTTQFFTVKKNWYTLHQHDTRMSHVYILHYPTCLLTLFQPKSQPLLGNYIKSHK
jgi:hypothetical protein